MIRTITAILKTLLLVILAGASLVASFYFAYILIFVGILGSIGGIAYYIFSRDKEDNTDWFDFID